MLHDCTETSVPRAVSKGGVQARHWGVQLVGGHLAADEAVPGSVGRTCSAGPRPPSPSSDGNERFRARFMRLAARLAICCFGPFDGIVGCPTGGPEVEFERPDLERAASAATPNPVSAPAGATGTLTDKGMDNGVSSSRGRVDPSVRACFILGNYLGRVVLAQRPGACRRCPLSSPFHSLSPSRPGRYWAATSCWFHCSIYLDTETSLFFGSRSFVVGAIVEGLTHRRNRSRKSLGNQWSPGASSVFERTKQSRNRNMILLLRSIELTLSLIHHLLYCIKCEGIEPLLDSI